MGNFLLKKKNKIKPIKNEESCVICLDDKNTNLMKVLPCNHKFHDDCLNQHLERGANDLCPICRYDLKYLKKKKKKYILLKIFVFLIYSLLFVPLSWMIGSFFGLNIIFAFGGIIISGYFTKKIFEV